MNVPPSDWTCYQKLFRLDFHIRPYLVIQGAGGIVWGTRRKRRSSVGVPVILLEREDSNSAMARLENGGDEAVAGRMANGGLESERGFSAGELSVEVGREGRDQLQSRMAIRQINIPPKDASVAHAAGFAPAFPRRWPSKSGVATKQKAEQGNELDRTHPWMTM